MKTRRTNFLSSLMIMGMLFFLLTSCSKKDTTPTPLTVTDMDGNIYQTVTIGSQIWMAENLKTTKFNDGSPIPFVPDSSLWGSLTSPGFCYYYNNPGVYKAAYGAMYNWYAVNSGKLAPTGWHVPTKDEWTLLTNYLGGDSLAGGKMKLNSPYYWYYSNKGATNSSGFTALPGGYRYYMDNSAFFLLGAVGNWWSATQNDNANAFYLSIGTESASSSQGSDNKANGFRIRCIKD